MTVPLQVTLRNMDPVAGLEAGVSKEIEVLERFFNQSFPVHCAPAQLAL